MTDNPATESARKAAPSRTKPPEVRLDELMGAAQALFLEKGVDATTISDITEAAGVAKGTFYVYFPSKQEMLAALGERYVREFVEQLERAVDACPKDDWVGRLRAWVQANVATYLRTYRVHDIVFTHPHHHAREGHTENEVIRQLQGILRAGAAAGAWRVDNPRMMALLIYAGVHCATDDAILSKLSDSTAFARGVADAYLRMLGVAV
ncbi:TetR family transcriptional regulator [Achromobacter xylosoxidans]|uniref:HTH-type transcriptional regulator BetI n=1 Tax=Achromobacter ruhlandii TaxID=72557 RepID=A0A848NML5_9BURK|nr:TetR/AcrR family transcriptional regulator [Achromobacter ruhlandii]AKP89619.1 Transcriptional regulator, TetR family [Achromobacter xylosoxidans]AOU92470.1 TetR family transcriptional regulator [Achromobacter ruhlandii]MCV6798581.1 TetR/AcrR family transcriptional regulator [Achromobacter ruhlandii]MCV6804106.1 TetR/AcrR family transcriptional regulator [Achromobacter ruhlandii]MCV6810803.1 TetR/AcrR family transcriptional regulator [Achromobacter ruhlandii]